MTQKTIALVTGDGSGPEMMAVACKIATEAARKDGVEIRFEAVRFRRDEADPDRLWVRAVGIANETEGKTPISRTQLERGDTLDLRFHDEIEVPFVAHVVYDGTVELLGGAAALAPLEILDRI